MIINREDILIWQNREEVFISLNEFQTIGCTKIRCKLLIETLRASVQVFYPPENSYLTIQYFITNICTTWQNAFICINFYEIKKQMSIYLFYHKNVRHVVSIECAKSQQNKLLMGMLITSRAITVIHVHDKSLKKLSYCKFCIYTHPVNSKFTIWQNCESRILIWFDERTSELYSEGWMRILITS